MPEPHPLDQTAAQWRGGLLVLTGEIIFTDCPADLLEHPERLAFGVQCLAPAPGKMPRPPHRLDRPGLVLLGDCREAHDLPVLLGQHVADQIIPRVKPKGRLSCNRCMIRMMAPFCLSLRRL
jgi:hypothetical protein